MKKFEKRDLQHPVEYEWKTNFDYFWNTKSNQKEWVLPKVLKEQSEKNGSKDFLQFSYNKAFTYSEVNTLANQIANSLNKLGKERRESFCIYAKFIGIMPILVWYFKKWLSYGSNQYCICYGFFTVYN